MSQLATTADIIAKFELQVSDSTELSAADELDLAQKVYDQVLSDREWEFLKKNATGTAVTANGVTTIALPTSFRQFSINHQSTDNSDFVDDNQEKKVIYMGSKYVPFKVINFSDRRRYLNLQGYCYLDSANDQIVFTQTPNTDTLAYDFDYIWRPAALDLANSIPVFPAEYWWVIVYGMAVDDTAIQLFDRAKTYAKENQVSYAQVLSDLRYYNSRLQND